MEIRGFCPTGTICNTNCHPFISVLIHWLKKGTLMNTCGYPGSSHPLCVVLGSNVKADIPSSLPAQMSGPPESP